MHLSKLTKLAGSPIVTANLDVTEASSTSPLHLHGLSGEFALSPFTLMHSLSGKEPWVPRCNPAVVEYLLFSPSGPWRAPESVEGVHFLLRDRILRNRSCLSSALWRQERGRADYGWGFISKQVCFLSVSWLKRSGCGLWNKSSHFKSCASWIRHVHFCF